MKDSKRLSLAFQRRRDELVRTLFAGVRDKRSATWTRNQRFEEIEPWGLGQLSTAIDLFGKWLETRDVMFQELFDGWVRSWMISHLSSEEIPADYEPAHVIRIAKDSWIDILRPDLTNPAIQTLEQDLDASISRLSRKPLRHLKALLIGDCIQLEALCALLGSSSQVQISITPVTVLERLQPALRNEIRSLPAKEFDLVFFSPFSHRYLNEYEILLEPGSLLWTHSRLDAHIAKMLHEISLTVETLVSHFDCSIYIHNTAGTTQSFGWLSGLAKNLLSFRNRAHARRTINAAISSLLRDPRFTAYARLHLIDEHSLREGSSDYSLARVCFAGYALHPTRLGLELGRHFYYEAAYTNAFLADKKVLVCDLDDTLWDGAIGEGRVTHFVERQELLLQLKKRGVLLSINSKNDAKNVNWLGAPLQFEDFVAPQINWEPKAVNVTRIRNELNLSIKDFVFLDNRPDELERVQNAFPEILTLDSSKPSTWRLLSHWQEILSPPADDRTRQYRERLQRTEYLNRQSAEPALIEDETAALKALCLSVIIRRAGSADLKRAVELINRTNQFNLCGSRTTLRELQEPSGRFTIVAEGRDKFGNMGIIGIMVADRKPDGIEIPIFVLSCRAFGFGFEYALLNSLHRLPNAARILGHYKETQFNGPCRKLYPNSGLTWDGQHWVGTVSGLRPDPDWLTVRRESISE
jgi:FkbH-like protein